MSDAMYDDYDAFVNEEILALAEEFDYWNDQSCEFDGESK